MHDLKRKSIEAFLSLKSRLNALRFINLLIVTSQRLLRSAKVRIRKSNALKRLSAIHGCTRRRHPSPLSDFARYRHGIGLFLLDRTGVKVIKMMADPMSALVSFQKEILAGMPTVASADSPNIRVFRDELNGKTRFSYARVEQGQVRSLVMFVSGGTKNGVPCFDVGYAVAAPWRGGGYAKEILAQGIKELSAGLRQATGLSAFWIVAVIGAENYASQSVAKSALSDTTEKIVDELSGLPALLFRRLISVEPGINA